LLKFEYFQNVFLIVPFEFFFIELRLFQPAALEAGHSHGFESQAINNDPANACDQPASAATASIAVAIVYVASKHLC